VRTNTQEPLYRVDRMIHRWRPMIRQDSPLPSLSSGGSQPLAVSGARNVVPPRLMPFYFSV
jgi:hypothetical protein